MGHRNVFYGTSDTIYREKIGKYWLSFNMINDVYKNENEKKKKNTNRNGTNAEASNLKTDTVSKCGNSVRWKERMESKQINFGVDGKAESGRRTQ